MSSRDAPETCDVCGERLQRGEGIQVPGPYRPVRPHEGCSKTPQGIELLVQATARSLGTLFPRPPGEGWDSHLRQPRMRSRERSPASEAKGSMTRLWPPNSPMTVASSSRLHDLDGARRGGRSTGITVTQSVTRRWVRTGVQPLTWSGRRDSNPRPPPWQSPSRRPGTSAGVHRARSEGVSARWWSGADHGERTRTDPHRARNRARSGSLVNRRSRLVDVGAGAPRVRRSGPASHVDSPSAAAVQTLGCPPKRVKTTIPVRLRNERVRLRLSKDPDRPRGWQSRLGPVPPPRRSRVRIRNQPRGHPVTATTTTSPASTCRPFP
jgi:hypothetical protein